MKVCCKNIRRFLQCCWTWYKIGAERSKKVTGDIIGQAKHNAFLTEWELAYYDVLDLSKNRSNITRSNLAETDATTLNKELWSKSMKEYYEAMKQAFDFLMKEAILTKWLDQSSYIISFQTKLYQALNQTAYCLIKEMGAKITWNLVKSLSRKKKRSLLTL